jgi:hypothetical protein
MFHGGNNLVKTAVVLVHEKALDLIACLTIPGCRTEAPSFQAIQFLSVFCLSTLFCCNVLMIYIIWLRKLIDDMYIILLGRVVWPFLTVDPTYRSHHLPMETGKYLAAISITK